MGPFDTADRSEGNAQASLRESCLFCVRSARCLSWDYSSTLLWHFTLALYSDPRSQDMLARNNMETCLASIFVLNPDPISDVYQGNQPLAINAAMRSW